jgi:DNA polymerase III subunit epsilon
MTVPWWQGRMCAVDVETTGTDPREARIVQAAVALVGGGLETESFSVLVDPGVPIPEEASAVHGITTEQAQAEGEPAELAVPAIVSAVSASRAAEHPIIVFNAPFDLTVLHHEALRYGMNPLSVGAIGFGPGLRVVDPLVIDRWLDRYRRGSRRLNAVCSHYGARLDGAHDAMHDALAATRLAWVMATRGRVIRSRDVSEDARKTAEWVRVRNDLDALHAAQVRWAAEQAAGLEQYFARQGKPERVERAWPVLA